jgi:hypothetical protein
MSAHLICTINQLAPFIKETLHLKSVREEYILITRKTYQEDTREEEKGR